MATPTLRAQAPRFRGSAITSISGYRSLTASGVPSVDALSTTTTAGCSGSWARTASVRQSSRTRSRVAMTTVTKGPAGAGAGLAARLRGTAGISCRMASRTAHRRRCQTEGADKRWCRRESRIHQRPEAWHVHACWLWPRQGAAGPGAGDAAPATGVRRHNGTVFRRSHCGRFRREICVIKLERIVSG